MNPCGLLLAVSLFVTSTRAAPYLDFESALTQSIVENEDDFGSLPVSRIEKRDPEVAAPLILDKREKKDFRSRRMMSRHPHRMRRRSASNSDPVLSGFSTSELARLLRLLDAWQADRTIPLSARDERLIWDLLKSYQTTSRME